MATLTFNSNEIVTVTNMEFVDQTLFPFGCSTPNEERCYQLISHAYASRDRVAIWSSAVFFEDRSDFLYVFDFTGV